MGAIIGLGIGSAKADFVGNRFVEPVTGNVLEYNVFVPTGFDPTNTTKKYPIMLVLHAANTNQIPPPRTLASDGRGWAPTFINTPHQATDPSFFMVPISQTNASGWGDPTVPITTEEKFEGRLAVLVLKQEVMTKYPIDPDRLYITGPSMGGRGTWDIIRRNPGMFAAAAPAAAPALADDAALYLNENIWAICGQVDPIVQGERDAVTAIRMMGGNPIYTELAGHGHDSWRWVYPDPQFVPWMFAQRRGVPWWTVSKPPAAPFTGGNPQATLSPGWPVIEPPAGLGGTFGGGGPSGAGGTTGTGSGGRGATGAGGAQGGGTGGAIASGTGGASTLPGSGGSSGAVSPPGSGGSSTGVGTGGAAAPVGTGGSSTTPGATGQGDSGGGCSVASDGAVSWLALAGLALLGARLLRRQRRARAGSNQG